VLVTARAHAQTVELARRRWPDILVIGDQSPRRPGAKALKIAHRAEELWRLARRTRPDVAFSHGSYAQLLAARAAGVPAVTMMDYEHQPANHLSFRLATRVIVPEVFPDSSLRRCGAHPRKVVRYPGFKEELYLEGTEPDPSVIDEMKLERSKVIAVMRPPPDGALYHRKKNLRFDELLDLALARRDVRPVVLPRDVQQRDRYARLSGVAIPARPIDGISLLASADVSIGAGGTMSRESALLGVPTYTVFSGPLGAVDAALIRSGLLRDLRAPGTMPVFEKRQGGEAARAGGHAGVIRDVVERTLTEVCA
jgi:predicted glycosyltransferase